jgi:uncharacterized protein involved in exopolysaccharide biosynthesis
MVKKSSPVLEENDEVIKIDLWKYVETLLRQWQWIVICVLGFGALAAGYSLITDKLFPSYHATALVSSAKTVSSVDFGSAITSQSETDIASRAMTGAQYLYDRDARLQSFVSLVKNGDVAQRVLEEIGQKFGDEKPSASELMDSINGKLIEKSDTILISANNRDPVMASEIANAWSLAYVAKINELYGGTSSSTSYLATQEETKKAKIRYETAQKALADFIAQNKIDEYTRQIEEIKVIVTSLRGARSTATTTIVNEEMGAEQQVINEFYRAQASNQLLALQQDQQSRRELITAYISALSQGRQDVFNQQVQDRLTRLKQAYTDSQNTKYFLDTAVSMRAAVNAGGDVSARSNALALALLKTQIYANFTGSNNLQIQNLPESLGSTIGTVDAAGMISDLDALISSLKKRQTDLDALIQTLSTEIQNGTGLDMDKALESTGELSQEIQARYPELFQMGELSNLSLDVVENGNPLASEAMQRSQALLQLKGLENLVDFTVADTPIERVIEENEQKMRDLNALISTETSKQTVLTRDRDLAWTTYSALDVKSAEMEVAAQTTGIEVIFSSPATIPEKTTMDKRKNTSLGLAVGLAFGVIIAYAYEIWQNHKGQKVEVLSKSMVSAVRNSRFYIASFTAWLRGIFTRKPAKVVKGEK